LSLQVVVLLACTLAFDTAEARSVFSGWSFGMSPEQVKKVKACKPYKPVKVHGGLECPNFKFLGYKINIAFIFRGGKLAKINPWVYQGKDPKVAARRLHKLLRYYSKKYGALESPQLKKPHKMSLAELQAMVANMQKGMAKVQFRPVKKLKKYFTFISLAHHTTHGFYLFLYFQPPR